MRAGRAQAAYLMRAASRRRAGASSSAAARSAGTSCSDVCTRRPNEQRMPNSLVLGSQRAPANKGAMHCQHNAKPQTVPHAVLAAPLPSDLPSALSQAQPYRLRQQRPPHSSGRSAPDAAPGTFMNMSTPACTISRDAFCRLPPAKPSPVGGSVVAVTSTAGLGGAGGVVALNTHATTQPCTHAHMHTCTHGHMAQTEAR